MKDEKKAPKLRFKGFTDDWEQRKLGDVADITTGSRNHQDSVTDGKYPFFVRSDKVERLNEYDFDTRAILVPGDGRIGEIFHYYNGKFALHQRVYKVDNFNGINALFLLGKFKYSFKKHALRLNAQGTVPSLRLPMFTNWNISIPNITEQERIGSFFRKLDRTITLHEEKKRQLERLKSALLKKMFADKSVYPAVRFKGFSDEWEQCKLGDISSSYSGGTPKAGTQKYYNGKIPFIRSGEISNGFTELTITEDGLRNSAAKMVGKGDILYALYGATSGEVSIARINGAINQAIMAIKPFEGYDSYLLASLLQNNKTKITEKYLQGGQGNLSATIVKNLELKVPSSKEQKLIGILLLRLDRSITLYEHKLELLKRLKCSLLQNMFI
ncbi:restriction endonuclease subunit S [Lactobacillus delbrueckii]|uniref:restriction endonuclease subunit S n=1 Tax=Lactobacillus delbrueckii TaxID=1584 RepID=UPI003A860EF8